MNKYLKLIISIVTVYSTAFFGSYFTFPSISGWYARLNKPFFNPPNWIFGPVWSVLYFFMGFGFYLVWKDFKLKKISKQAIFFFMQLFFNFLWSFVFFGLKKPLYAYMIIILLFFLIVLMIWEFKKISKLSALLQLPYLFWVSFASVLNLAIILLN